MTKSILPDGLDDTRMVIVKACTRLRLTDEIRIAETVARDTHRELVLAVGEDCLLSPELAQFVAQRAVTIYRTSE